MVYRFFLVNVKIKNEDEVLQFIGIGELKKRIETSCPCFFNENDFGHFDKGNLLN